MLKEGKDFDFGGKVEFMFGGDTRYTHAAGLLQNTTSDQGTADPARHSLDLLESTARLRLPVGNGLVVKFGRFVTPLSAEVIDATGNAFYSHSFLFNYASPFTHVGVKLDYLRSPTRLASTTPPSRAGTCSRTTTRPGRTWSAPTSSGPTRSRNTST